ncbi:hypothetical protein LR48_Vigan09g018500, partial [Vigna angularis]
IKSFKKFPLTLRFVVLVVTVLCGIYIFTISVEQKGVSTSNKLLENTVFKQPCHHPPGVEEWEVSYLHYPEPKTFSREECACNPVRFFCIVSMQRSGSGWFETFLNSHINGLMEHHEEIGEYFERRRVSIIFLFRKNLLRRMISVLANAYDKDAKALNGTHKSHVHSATEAKILANYKPRLNITLLIPELKIMKETAAKAITYFRNTRHIVLYYDDLVHNRTKLKDVQEFLRVPYRDLESRQVKIHTAPLSEQIENWDEVQEELTGTPFQWFLGKNSQIQ